jgi:hypothetical protein
VHIGIWPVARSVLLFLGVPLVGGVLLRCLLLRTHGKAWFETRFMPKFGPLALAALIYTIVVMFICQADKIVNEVGQVARVAVPMMAYFLFMFFGSLAISWQVRDSPPGAVAAGVLPGCISPPGNVLALCWRAVGLEQTCHCLSLAGCCACVELLWSAQHAGAYC